ncbi:helix-turn-helix domain-containing protein [Streptomyces sp. NPDC001276]|uniref:helix-turn-helix domain-containing protein n=1 Tax=Streptomyces sp. NPDC001276 TaxID=3364555 RepID=UPI0036C29B84
MVHRRRPRRTRRPHPRPLPAHGRDWAGYTDVQDGYTWDPATYIPGVAESQVHGAESALWAERVATFEEVQYMTLPRLPGIAHDRQGLQVDGVGSPRRNGCWRRRASTPRERSRWPTTAGALCCHRNTVQHRFARFAELTGQDIRRPDDVALVDLALRAAGRRTQADART